MELLLRAAELGSPEAQFKLGYAYTTGSMGMEEDLKKGKSYWERAAMGGHAEARHNLGISEIKSNNCSRATRHFMIAARAGYDDSVQMIRKSFESGLATKEEYEHALRAHKESKDETKSDLRAITANVSDACASLFTRWDS